ncbi:WD repeat-containing and planar cell polarity effector protein [Sesbania bispinosa]|nr:WD repeat-containing and planar cell polarity effector protein [Sesbania bispinosa]
MAFSSVGQGVRWWSCSAGKLRCRTNDDGVFRHRRQRCCRADYNVVSRHERRGGRAIQVGSSVVVMQSSSDAVVLQDSGDER